jgi:hypothetical protein
MEDGVDEVPDFTKITIEEPTLAELTFVAQMANSLAHGKQSEEAQLAIKKTFNWLSELALVLHDEEKTAQYARQVLEETGYDKNVERMLTISTAHVSKATAAWLNEVLETWADKKTPEIPSVSVYGHGSYGWQINVPTEEGSWEEIVKSAAPTDLVACMAAARNRGCYWLLLDADAEQLDDLTTYDW